jgi:hypothetical protein
MNQSNSSKQVLLSVIGVAILVVAVVGVSFAFFNYTRTGAANTVTTGTIHFASSQTYMNVENAFPITKSAAQSSAGAANNENVTTATVTITGDTTYGAGLAFRITAQNVTKVGVANGSVPISVLVTKTTNDQNNKISITTHDYERTNDASTNYGLIQDGSILAEGTIVGDGTEVNETITIKAFIDSAFVAITDTKEGEAIAAGHGAETGYSDVNPYSNGTTTGWINGRTVLTTAQWNALHSNPASFTIRVEAINAGGQYAYAADGTSRGTIPVPSNRS